MVLILSVLMALFAAAQVPALRESLADAGITPRPALPRALGDARADGVAVTGGYIAAWWESPDFSYTALHLFTIDRGTGKWRDARFKSDEIELPGPFQQVRGTANYITIEMKQTPSASSTLVFRRDLSRAGAFYGWTRTWLPNDLIVFEQSQMHFAPTHPLGVAVFDPASRSSRAIYPPVPAQGVRREFIERVRTRWSALGEQWFMEHNHHGDPTRFDASAGEFVTDWAHHALAFDVIYSDDLETLPPISEQVIVTCDRLMRATTASCHESPRSEWERLFPGVQGTDLLHRAAAQPRLVRAK